MSLSRAGGAIFSISFMALPQQVRFVAIGGVNTVIGYSVFGLLIMAVSSDLTVVLMAYLAHILASPFAFLLYRSLVFPTTRGITSSFLRFQAAYALPLALNGPLLYFGISVLGANPLILQALLTAVFAIMMFIVNRYFSFGSPRKPKL